MLAVRHRTPYMSSPQRTIFVFSLEPWGNMWYSKHHYAARLAKSHAVYFVSLPDRWRWTDLFSFSVKVRSVEEGVNVVEYRNNLPLRFLPRWLVGLVARLNALKLQRLLPNGEVLYWSFHPTSVLDHKTLRRPGSKTIYHVVDPYQSLPNDSAFAKRSDLVVAINPWYLEYYGKLNPNCMLIPHGVRTEDRAHNARAALALQQQWGRYMVLATGLSQHVNYALLYKVATHYPDVSLVVVGQLFDLKPAERALRDRLFALPNVRYDGVKHPDDLKDLIKGAVVGLLTYDIEPTLETPISAGRTPLKVLTYLAQLCPVVSTNNSFINVLEGKGHFKAENEDHFVALVGDVLLGTRRVETDTVNTYLDSVEYGKIIDRILLRLDASEVQAPPPTTDGADQQPSLLNVNAGSSKKIRKLIPQTSPILIVSNEGWDGPRYSKHRMALALSTLRKIYFIDPPDQWRPSHLLRMRIRARSTPEGITVLTYNNAIPLLGGRLGALNDWIIAGRLRTYLRRAGGDSPVFWTFDPSRLAEPAQLGAGVAIYHCADDHAFRWRGEALLAQRCDHVFCIARDLMPRFNALNPSVHHVPHGLADTDMMPAASAHTAIASGYGLYIGNINDRHDFALWEKLFRDHPQRTFIIVGPIHVTDPIGLRLINDAHMPNVRFMGPVPYDRLPSLIAGAAFGFLYMRPDHPANRISSQKVVQFLAQGKPFFCSWFSEYADQQDLVYMTDDHQEALNAFDRWCTIGEAPEARQRRLDFAGKQRFINLVAQLPFRF